MNKANNNLKCIICSQISFITNTDLPVCKECLLQQAQNLEEYENQLDQYHQNVIQHQNDQDQKLQDDSSSISEIIPNKLYLGNYIAAKNEKLLKKYQITHILVCGDFLKQKFPQDFIYHQIQIQDSLNQSILEYLDETNNFIEASKTVFVHCAAGINRSPAIVCAYIMKKENWTYDQAFDYVKSKRPEVNKQTNFAKQLQTLDYGK